MFEILQGSLLAGGVTSGAIAATQLQPWTCLTIGLGLGVMIVVSGLYLEPLVSLCLNTPRAYISLTVHGIPALLGAVIGVILAAISEEKQGLINYRNILYQHFRNSYYSNVLSYQYINIPLLNANPISQVGMIICEIIQQ